MFGSTCQSLDFFSSFGAVRKEPSFFLLGIQVQATLKGKTLPNSKDWNFICMTGLGTFDSPRQQDQSQNKTPGLCSYEGR